MGPRLLHYVFIVHREALCADTPRGNGASIDFTADYLKEVPQGNAMGPIEPRVFVALFPSDVHG